MILSETLPEKRFCGLAQPRPGLVLWDLAWDHQDNSRQILQFFFHSEINGLRVR